MADIKTGGFAFPNSEGWKWPGMTLRDWLAGRAVAGLAKTLDEDTYAIDIARDAYTIADAMLIVREEHK